MSDLWTENPRAVQTYDVECAGRWDHDAYLAVADEVGARTVVDVGCGTGVFAVDVARRGMTAIGVDPAAAMLDAARARTAAARADGETLDVRWVHGTAADVPADVADLVVMMGHVAQYFVTDEDWAELLRHCRRILRDGGLLAFESRQPDRDWPARFTTTGAPARLPHPDGGEFTTWSEVVDVVGPPTSFVETHVGHTVLPDGTRFAHTETLRFRSEAEIRSSLREAGYAVEEVWGAWDRTPVTPTSDELIVLARAGRP